MLPSKLQKKSFISSLTSYPPQILGVPLSAPISTSLGLISPSLPVGLYVLSGIVV